MTDTSHIEQCFRLARERYAEIGVDVERAIETLRSVPISLHCWQGDDVGGFESAAGLTGGGIQATGNYPGRARTADELRADLDQALSLIPGRCRLNLHAIYADYGGKRIERNELAPQHFASWVQWARSRELGLDFNPTFFSHPLAESGFTLSSRDAGIRRAAGRHHLRHDLLCERRRRRLRLAHGRRAARPHRRLPDRVPLLALRHRARGGAVLDGALAQGLPLIARRRRSRSRSVQPRRSAIPRSVTITPASLRGVASTRNPGLCHRLRKTVPVSGVSTISCL